MWKRRKQGMIGYHQEEAHDQLIREEAHDLKTESTVDLDQITDHQLLEVEHSTQNGKTSH